ncbi:hypothetical protein NBRC116188_02720 [Oceaniserpentilla sp. 4NH20-0058]|uniref:hypothetical protein n=1 Tax=Oceaniserpentilla sp. 4NH20-0058 TaxID=3127660 RepID=UPI00310BB70B
MADTPKNTISHPLGKFAIGLIAGFVAIVIPRLSSDLSTLDNITPTYYTSIFFISVAGFAILIGLVITILEYKVPRTPKDTLFSALAIPALIAGSLNTAIETQNSNEILIQSERISQEARKTNLIETENVQSIEIIQFNQSTEVTPKNNFDIRFSLFAQVYANDPTNKQLDKKQNSLFIQRQNANYAVSLYQFKNKNEAIEKAKSLQQQNIPVTLIKTSSGSFDVISDSKLMTETDATLNALTLKNLLNITPKLLKLK